MQKSFFIMLPDNKRVHLQGTSLEEVSRIYNSWPKDTQQEMSKGQLYMTDEKGNWIATEFIKSPEKENEIVLPPKLEKILVYLVLPLGTLYLLGFWAGLTLVFFYSLPWLSRKVKEDYDNSNHPQKASIATIWLVIIGLVIGTICLIGYVEGPIYIPLGKEVTLVERDTVENLHIQRVSCDSVSSAAQTVKYQDSLTIYKRIHLTGTWMFGYTKRDTIRHTYKISRKDPSYINVASPLENFCGDTIVSKKYKPYEDRNFSLIKVNKKYYDANYRLVDTTFYRNRSPQIHDLDLIHLFTKKQAPWYHTVRDNKYTLSLLHENKVDTLDSREDAQGLLEAKCKDAATKKKEFSYAEYNACKGNGDITKIKVSRIETCGYASVRISYGSGAISSRPYGCWGSTAGWWYEQ